ncbi:XRE family transcriptional regulator [Aromatoleum toluclasticum]|uniref:XRE family transcriptional regulator n=1 Tax=Aromatoleum toluclasticum TaxID=92003 RepID=UPI0038BE0B74
MNQAECWSRLSVTQSGGSRYEGGRTIASPVRLLLHLTYGTDKQAGDLLAWLRNKECVREPARSARRSA